MKIQTEMLLGSVGAMCSFNKNGVCDSLWKEKHELGTAFLTAKYKILNNKI
jgi:hypothetical protein